MSRPAPYSLLHPPRSLCILRLSALGDAVNLIPIVRTLQTHWPTCQITWIIGKTESALLGRLDGVEFIPFDKRQGLSSYRGLKRQLGGRRFDVLLHMQAALRASWLSLLVKSPVRVGYDRARAKDAQWLFSNRSVAAVPGQHVVDGFFAFLRAIGLAERELRWDLPISPTARHVLDRRLEPARPLLVVHPCSSQRRRNWRDWPAERHAAVIDHAVQKHGVQVALSGDASRHEREAAQRIGRLTSQAVVDLSGETSLEALWALLERADALIAPDTGPIHIASALSTPAIGLYASSNPARTGPYSGRHWVVNRYPQALRRYARREINEVAWGARVRHPDAMRLISVADVTEKLDQLLSGAGTTVRPTVADRG